MPLREFYSVRIADPKLCGTKYAQARKGAAGGDHLEVYDCIPKKYESEVSEHVTNQEWNMYGVKQRYLIPISHVEPCTKGELETLCPLDERGDREIASIEERNGVIIKMPGGKKYEYTTTEPRP